MYKAYGTHLYICCLYMYTNYIGNNGSAKDKDHE